MVYIHIITVFLDGNNLRLSPHNHIFLSFQFINRFKNNIIWYTMTIDKSGDTIRITSHGPIYMLLPKVSKKKNVQLSY